MPSVSQGCHGLIHTKPSAAPGHWVLFSSNSDIRTHSSSLMKNDLVGPEHENQRKYRQDQEWFCFF